MKGSRRFKYLVVHCMFVRLLFRVRSLHQSRRFRLFQNSANDNHARATGTVGFSPALNATNELTSPNLSKSATATMSSHAAVFGAKNVLDAFFWRSGLASTLTLMWGLRCQTFRPVSYFDHSISLMTRHSPNYEHPSARRQKSLHQSVRIPLRVCEVGSRSQSRVSPWK